MLGEDALAFSTCCQNFSELGGGCFWINSSRDLASAFIVRVCMEHLAGSRKSLGRKDAREIAKKEKVVMGRVVLLRTARLRRDKRVTCNGREEKN